MFLIETIYTINNTFSNKYFREYLQPE